MMERTNQEHSAKSTAPSIGAVIPTWQAATAIVATLEALRGGVTDMVVVDGGSDDGTPEIAARQGVRVVAAARGRGRQLGAGAAAVAGDWLLFIHADTVLEPDWVHSAHQFCRQQENQTRAAAFRFATDLSGAGARWLERYVAWRCGFFGLAYGDQGLLIHREFYNQLGGYAPMPIMEDVDLVRRIGKRRLQMLSAAAVTSGRRYQKAGVCARGARNLACLIGYFLGVPTTALARLYGS